MKTAFALAAFSAAALPAAAFVAVQAPTGLRAGSALSATSGTQSQDKTILQVLADEHHQAMDMLKQITSTSDVDEKRKLTEKVITDLVRHSIVEETLVYPLIKDKVEDGDKKVSADAEEHQILEQTMRELEKTDPSTPGYNSIAERLLKVLDVHRTKEEKEQFPALSKQVSEQELKNIVGRAELLKKVAPTHPHPSTHVHNQAFNLGPGAVVGLVDKARDAFSGRNVD